MWSGDSDGYNNGLIVNDERIKSFTVRILEVSEGSPWVSAAARILGA
jgi:hypothetical protein